MMGYLDLDFVWSYLEKSASRVYTWLLGDHLGSTSMTANADGTFLSEVRYSAFGEVRDSSGTMTTDYLYTGQRQEAEVGLYYYVARWYDPAIGRFVQADSIIPDPSNPKGYDRYAYAYNNPVKYTDPTGHFVDPFSLFIGAFVGGAIVGGAISAYNQYKETGSVDVGKVAEAAVGGALIGGGAVIVGVVAVAVGTSVAGAITAGTAVATAASIIQDPSDEINAITSAVSADGDPRNEVQAAVEFSDDIFNVTDKARSVDQFLSDAQKFIGSSYRQIAEGVYRATDGLRQVRFTERDIGGHRSPIGSHGHFELLNDLGKVVKNIHIPLIEEILH